MRESFESLRRLFSDAGYAFVEPPLLHGAGAFVELLGEDLRQRMFLTAAADGVELALRPDYTIPVCLHHLATGKPARRADYAYLGPVFRQRKDEPGEFLQAGVESLGRRDRAAADADMLALALAAARQLGVARPRVTVGDSGLFAAVVDALGLPEPWRRRLARSFGDGERLSGLLARLAAGEKPPVADGDFAGLDPANRRVVRRAVEAGLARAGLATVGGRGADEIADRFADKAALAAGNRRAVKALRDFLAIGGNPPDAAKALRKYARGARIDIDGAIAAFAERTERFAQRGIDTGALAFTAGFGRRLDYYTGFVFEIHDRPGAQQIVGGGRYDRLLGLIHAPGAKPRGTPVPAVGFSIWLDRIGSAG